MRYGGEEDEEDDCANEGADFAESALQRVVDRRGQVLCATHSPVLAAMPGARILEAGPWGLRETAWDDLDLVDHWRRYLAEPTAYLRHLLDG